MSVINKEKVVDLHIHSKYSQATSKYLSVESLWSGAKIKGIHILGTGDFTHPAWFEELEEKLEPAEDGLYVLKDTYARDAVKDIPESCKDKPVRFVYSVEISCIYTKYEKVRKAHHVIVTSSKESAAKINQKLSEKWNLRSDGRPILALDSSDLLTLVLDIDPQALFIPAHIWTPWFGIFGSKSGFNSLEEAFGENAQYIYAIESGLDSDPYMNHGIVDLGSRAILSHSDAHSTQKLGREATIFNIPFSYKSLYESIRKNDEKLIGTVEFFPAEGKYHYDGHKACEVCLPPEKSRKLKGICPVCDRKMVLGVQYRIEELQSQSKVGITDYTKTVEYIVPLVEILAEVLGVRGINSQAVSKKYNDVITQLGNEFNLLRKLPIETITSTGYSDLALAIESMRLGTVDIQPGYDGVFGKVSLLKTKSASQTALEF